MIRRAGLILLAAALLAACGNGQSPYEQNATQHRVNGVLPITPTALATRMAAGEQFQVVDVRTADEFASGHIAGAANVPVEGFDPGSLSPADGRERIYVCRTGKRSGALAQRLANAHGGTVIFLQGGVEAWEKAGLPLVR